MANEHVKSALKKKNGRKLHTHEVTYRRADNGGIHAKVQRHTKDGHHHEEDHVLANFGDAASHFQEHMGDQPDAGAGPMAAQAEPDPSEMAGAAGPDGAGGSGASPMPPSQGM